MKKSLSCLIIFSTVWVFYAQDVSATHRERLNASNLITGTLPNPRLDPSSVTLQGNTINISTVASGLQAINSATDSLRTTFYGYSSTADANQEKFVNFRSTTDNRVNSQSNVIVASDESIPLSTMTRINFTGAGVTVTNTGSTINVTVSGLAGGGAGAINVFDRQGNNLGTVSTVTVGQGLIGYIVGESTLVIRDRDIRFTTGIAARWNFWESSGSDKIYDTVVSTRFGYLDTTSPNTWIAFSTGGLNRQAVFFSTGGIDTDAKAGTFISQTDGIYSSHAGASGKISVAIWFHPTKTGANQDLLEKSQGANEWFFRLDSTNAMVWSLYSSAGANTTTYTSSSSVVNTNEDNFALVSFDRTRASGSRAQMWVNGNPMGAASTDDETTSDADSDNFTIGSAGGVRAFQGKIMQITIWNYALNASQAKRAYEERLIENPR